MLSKQLIFERMAKVQSYPVFEGWRRGQCRYFQFCNMWSLCRPVSDCKMIFADEFWFFEKLNETILGRECNGTVFQPLILIWHLKKPTKSWKDMGIRKKARVNRHNDLVQSIPLDGESVLMDYSFVPSVYKTHFFRISIRN